MDEEWVEDGVAEMEEDEMFMYQPLPTYSNNNTNKVRYIQYAESHRLTARDPKATQPAHVIVPLRPHQLTLLAAARNLEKHATITLETMHNGMLYTDVGVIADRVGSGKSLVVLGLLRDPPINGNHLTFQQSGGAPQFIKLDSLPPIQEIDATWHPSSLSSMSSMSPSYVRSKPPQMAVRTSLIIVPHIVFTQWDGYIKQQLRGINYVGVRRTADCDPFKPGFFNKIFAADVILISSTMLKHFRDSFREIGFESIVWSRVFIDEADSITLGLNKEGINYRFLWLITGSWQNMLFPKGESFMDIHSAGVKGRKNLIGQSLVSYLNRPEFAAIVLRNSDEWIDSSIITPEIIHRTITCQAPKSIRLFRGIINPEAMEALHAGDTASALGLLGFTETSSDPLVDRVTAKLRFELDEATRILEFKRTLSYSSDHAREEALKKAESRVNRIQSDLDALIERLTSDDGPTHCPICYDIPQVPALSPCCRNTFCLGCICQCMLTRPVCPMCRADLDDVKSLILVAPPPAADGLMKVEVPKDPTKNDALLKVILDADPSRKFLVFSAYEASFKEFQRLMKEHNIRCELLNGTSAHINHIRTLFNKGTVRVLCLNARYVGAGLNLEAATDVILYHSMNRELEQQVIGRAVRFDRSAPLTVTHLLHSSEV